MTMAPQTELTTELDVDEAVDAGSRGSSRWSKRVKLAAAGAALVVVLGGGGAYALVGSQRAAERLEDANAALVIALDDHDALVDAANRAVQDGEVVLLESEGRVADDSVREALSALLTSSADVIKTATVTALADDAALDDVTAFTADIATTDTTLKASTTALVAATQAVRAAHSAWELVDARATFDAATVALTSANHAASAVQTGSEGKVHDNAVREELALVLTSAAETLAIETTLTDPAVMREAADARMALVTSLEAAQGAVAAAQETWQSDQDKAAAQAAKAAAEKAATEAEAARVAAISPSKVKSGNTPAKSGNTSTGAPSTTKKPSTGASTPQKAPGGGGYYLDTEETTYGDLTYCMDTVGNSWLC